MWTTIAALVGLASTIAAWFLNPRRKLYAELDDIYQELELLYQKRDEALHNNDNDALTIVTQRIVRLCERKALLLQRF